MARREAERAAPRFVACAFAPCSQCAHVYVETPSGAANVCPDHYLFLAHSQAVMYCEAQGLSGVAAMREFCRRKMKRFARGTFADWAETITQGTVAIMLRSHGSQGALRKLQDGGYIDSDFRVTGGLRSDAQKIQGETGGS